MHMSSCPLSGSGVLSSVGTTLHIPRPIETTAEPTRETTRAQQPHSQQLQLGPSVAQRKHAHSSSVTPDT